MKRAEREAQRCTFKGHILFCTSSSMHPCSDSSWIHMMTDSLRTVLKLLTGRLCVLRSAGTDGLYLNSLLALALSDKNRHTPAVPATSAWHNAALLQGIRPRGLKPIAF